MTFQSLQVLYVVEGYVEPHAKDRGVFLALHNVVMGTWRSSGWLLGL